MTYASTVLADSPLTYLRLGDASGTTATDSSGSSRSGTYVGSPTLGVAGALTGDSDTAVTFNGSTQYASIAGAAWMNVTDYSIEFWFKATTASASTLVIVNRDDGVSAASKLWDAIMVSGKLRFQTYNNGSSAETIDTTNTYNDGNWHHCVMTKSGTAKKIYVDGVQDGSGTGTTFNTSSTLVMNLARRSNNTLFWPGTLDEFAFYSGALSSTQIAAHHTAGITSTHTASATLSAAATLSSGRVATRRRSDSLNAVATLSSTRVRGQRRPATLAAAATLSSRGSTATRAAANLAAAATLASARVRGRIAAATLAAVATLSPSRVRGQVRTVQLDATATLSSTAPTGKTATATLNAVATLLSTPARPVVAPAAGPFKWGFQMLAPGKALLPIEAGLDFIEWGFVMLQPGDALIGDPA